MPLPLWRSMLYIPANNDRFIAKATQRGADAIILDLEDSVPFECKAETQQSLAGTINALAGQGSDILVRVTPALRLCVEDIAAAVRPGVAALFLPKIASVGHLEMLDDYIADIERERCMAVGSVALVPMIETPRALQQCEAIASARQRNVALILGAEDLASEAGLVPSAETLRAPKLRVAMAAKAAGLLALGLLDTVARLDSDSDLDDMARQAADHGFDGAPCIHPASVPALNRGFTPSAEALETARRTVTAMESAWASGKGAATLKGRMIDLPVYHRAQRLIARYERIVNKNRVSIHPSP